MSKTYCEETHCQMFESAKKQIRADAIEEYKKKLLDTELYRCTDGNEYVDVADIEFVAEQLKE